VEAAGHHEVIRVIDDMRTIDSVYLSVIASFQEIGKSPPVSVIVLHAKVTCRMRNKFYRILSVHRSCVMKASKLCESLRSSQNA